MNVPQTEQALLSFGRTEPRSIYADGLRESTVDRAFEDLFAQHYPRLVKTLLRLTGDSGQAEELAADALCASAGSARRATRKVWPDGSTGRV